MLKKILLVILSLLIILVGWVGFDLYQNSKIVRTHAKTEFARSLNLRENDVLTALEEGEEVDVYELRDSLAYIDKRFDTSDFRLPSLIRILYAHEDKLPDDLKEEIKVSLTGFKYWMDQPGDDSMCYWSENHQLLFSTSEYLIGNYYSDVTFSNMNITGSEHSKQGKERVLIWLEQRFLYGFTEWYSSTYYVEDIAPLSVLVDFAPDEEVREKAKIVLDLLIYDLATQNYKGTFTTNSGRMYESAKMSGTRGSMKESISIIWPDYNEYIMVEDFRGMEVNFKYIKNYEVPEVLINIGYDQQENHIYKASTGVNLSEYKDEDLLGLNDNQIMMQLNSEAFTNPEVINNTIKYIDKNEMFANEFLADFKMINLGVLKTFNLADNVSRLLEPMYDGTAIQRANTYMYRTPNYAMATAQAYHPGMYGDQHSLFSLTINNDVNIFTQHPASSLKEDGALGNSPNYWVGNGYHPHTVQHENVNLTIWELPDEVNQIGELAGMARKINDYTHAYFPMQYMDEVVIEGHYAFAKFEDTYVALIGKNDLYYNEIKHTDYEKSHNLTENYDLIQEGKSTYWITIAGTRDEYETFENFMSVVKNTEVTYENETLKYENLELTYLGDFKVGGEVMDLEYLRFENESSTTERKADVIEIEFGNQKLELDFKNAKRTITN